MGRTDDILFGKIAVAHHIVTPEQLADCVSAQAMAGETVPLGQIMIERGLMAPDELELLLRVQREGLEKIDPDTNLKRETLLFGKIVVQEGFATQEEVNICVRSQALNEEQGRSHRSLGDIMVEKGYLTSRQMQKILEKQQSAAAEAQSALGRPGMAPSSPPPRPAPPPPAPAPVPEPKPTPAPPEPEPVESEPVLEPLPEPVIEPILEPIPEEPPAVAEPEPPPPPPPPPPPKPPVQTPRTAPVPPPRPPAPPPARPPQGPPKPPTTSVPARPPTVAIRPGPAPKSALIKKLQCPICDNEFQAAIDPSGWVKCPQCGTGFSPK